MRNWNEALHDIFQFDWYVVYFWQNRNNLWFAKYSTNCQYSAEWNISWYMYSTFLFIKFRNEALRYDLTVGCGAHIWNIWSCQYWQIISFQTILWSIKIFSIVPAATHTIIHVLHPIFTMLGFHLIYKAHNNFLIIMIN